MELIYLIGMRGTGKTTTGRMLAQKMRCRFQDLDHRLTSDMGKSIDEIVRADGWEKFRELESGILRKVTEEMSPRGGVIATGGGIILAEENRRHLKNTGTVIWLAADPVKLHARLCANPFHAQRPALTEKEPLEEIRAVLAQRERLYAACAHHVLNADGSPDQVCEEIFKIAHGA